MSPKKALPPARPETLWEYRTPNPDAAEKIVRDLHLNPLLADVLAARGYSDISEISSFLNPRLSAIEDPNLLKDMSKGIDRLAKALKNNEKICIYGDYDVDGITATVLMLRFLEWLGKPADYYIPNRISEGYGMNCPAIDKIARKGTKLIVTVDNGITSFKEVAYARSLGIDVIITDHHQPGEKLPDAVAIINPKRKDAEHSHTPLAGVGVAFKFIYAFSRQLDLDPEAAKDFLISLLDLVALGTVADIVPLTGENRTLVRYGLQKIETTDKVGLQTLLQLTCSRNQGITPDTISYSIGPRINAAGRSDQASLCVDLLLTDDNLRAVEISRRLNRLNDERRKLEDDILGSCLLSIEQKVDLDKEHVLVISGEGWHIGVVGIVASRLLERFYKPTIVLAVDRNRARGSGRSIAGFDLFQALSSCSDCLKEYGGHKRAVGLTLNAKDIPTFRERINRYAKERLDPSLASPRITIDGEVNADVLTLDNVASLSAMEPLGASNPAPVFSMRGVSLLEPARVVGRNHLKLLLCQDGISLGGIGFSMAGFMPLLKDTARSFHISFTPFINEWKGYRNVELELKDIKIE